MHCSVMGREALEAAIDHYRIGSTSSRTLEGKIVCSCFGVTEEEIRRVIGENNLKTVEQVTNYCKAGGGCGGCHPDIEEFLGERSDETTEPALPKASASSALRKPLTNIQKIQLVQKTLNEQVRPALQADGGDLELIDVDGNRVIIAFRGMCAQCQVSDFTMAEVVQAKLRIFVSEDIIVEEQKP